ncbi:ion transporter [Lacibacterium aquatile]|uniref:Ion transporter n=1 Tax=Lacibacterium aquatile TaxID=1168082 RepID=A0ABW5DWA1_9PROT
MDFLKNLVESKRFERAIIALILLNAITLGLETSKAVMDAAGGVIELLDHIILAVFVFEVVARLVVYRLNFFKDPWRIFDLLIVVISLLPATGNLSIMRALRVLRVMRMVAMVPSMRRVVNGLIGSLPGMGSVTLLLCLVFYVAAVMATRLYGEDFEEFFGTIGASSYTLFQIMTLEGWSGEVVRPVMEKHPLAWAFFLPFILVTTFTVLNLFIGIIVSAMEDSAKEEEVEQGNAPATADQQTQILEELQALRREVAVLRQSTAAPVAGE